MKSIVAVALDGADHAIDAVARVTEDPRDAPVLEPFDDEIAYHGHEGNSHITDASERARAREVQSRRRDRIETPGCIRAALSCELCPERDAPQKVYGSSFSRPRNIVSCIRVIALLARNDCFLAQCLLNPQLFDEDCNCNRERNCQEDTKQPRY